MANRSYVRNQMSLVRNPVSLYAKVSIGAVGAPTLQILPAPNKCMGIYSMVRTGAGAYTVNLGLSSTSVDTYQYLLSAHAITLDGTNPSTWACMQVVQDNSATISVPNLHIEFLDFAGAPVDPASGSVILLKLELSNSSVM